MPAEAPQFALPGRLNRTRTGSVKVMCGGKSQSHMHARAFSKRPVEVEKNSASAHVLRLGQQFVNCRCLPFDDCRQAHIETPHGPPVLRDVLSDISALCVHRAFQFPLSHYHPRRRDTTKLHSWPKILNCQQFARPKRCRELIRLLLRRRVGTRATKDGEGGEGCARSQ